MLNESKENGGFMRGRSSAFFLIQRHEARRFNEFPPEFHLAFLFQSIEIKWPLKKRLLETNYDPLMQELQ